MEFVQLTSLRISTYEKGQATSTFIPIPQLTRDHANVDLVFLFAKSIRFTEPVDDEFFAAHKPRDTELYNVNGKFERRQTYGFDGVAHVIGCVTQEQFCVDETSCTPLESLSTAVNIALNMTAPGLQREFLQTWAQVNSALGISLNNVIQTLGSSALAARDSCLGGVQGPLSPNQWQTEIEHWHAIILALKQRAFVETATGPPSDVLAKLVERPTNKWTNNYAKVR